MKNFLVTDRHLYHSNIIRYCNRPLEHMQILHENWRKIVKPEDTVYDLGDVVFANRQSLKLINESLPGRKILIKGNHDRETDEFYLKSGYVAVVRGVVLKYAKGKLVLLTHKPIDIGSSGEIEYNIHGHLHNLGYESPEVFGENYAKCHDENHILLSMEFERYKPVELQQFISRHEARVRAEMEKEPVKDDSDIIKVGGFTLRRIKTTFADVYGKGQNSDELRGCSKNPEEETKQESKEK